MAIPTNMQVLYIIWNCFSMWIQWWCPLHDQSYHIWQLYIIWNCFSMWIQWWCLLRDQSYHIWQYQQICKCYISSGTIFRCEFNGDVCFVIRVKKFLKTLSRLRSEMRKLDNVKAKIQDKEVSQIQCHGQDLRPQNFSRHCQDQDPGQDSSSSTTWDASFIHG